MAWSSRRTLRGLRFNLLLAMLWLFSHCSDAGSNNTAVPFYSFHLPSSATSTSPLPQLRACAMLEHTSPLTGAEEMQRQCNQSSRVPIPPTNLQPLPEAAVQPAADTESTVALPGAEPPREPQHNFALEKDGAKVIASNAGAKKVVAILDDDSDTFMRNDCASDKWVILELSQVARVSRVEVAQYELYSSRVREFEVRGRQSHPRTDGVDNAKGLNGTAWKLLGSFAAEKAKGTQSFSVDHPIWVRYLLVRFLTHYGGELVCAINGFSVFGRSAAEELEDQLAADAEEEGLVMAPGEEGERAALPVEELPAGAVGGAESPEGGAQQRTTTEDFAETASNDSSAAGHSLTGSLPNKNAAAALIVASAADAAGPAAMMPAAAPHSGGKKQATQPVLDQEHRPTNIAAIDPPSMPFAKGAAQRAGTATLAAPPAAAPGKNVSAGRKAAGNSAVPDQAHADQRAADGGQQAPGHLEALQSLPGGGAQSAADILEELPVPKAKASGVYEVLVQEIRAARAQQRLTAKAVEALQRNLTALSAMLFAARTQYELSDEALGRRVDAVVSAHLTGAARETASLRAAMRSAAKREHAALSLLAMLAAVLVLNMPRFGSHWPLARRAVVGLAVANCLVGVVLHRQGGSAAQL